LALLSGCASQVGLLLDADEDVRAEAARRILAQPQQRVASDQLPSLLEALADPEPLVRAAAASLLGSLGDERAVEPLFLACGDPEPRVMEQAALALGAFHPSQLQEGFERRLRSPDPERRLQAARVAEHAGHSSLRLPALSLLADASPQVRDQAMELARSMGPEALPELFVAAARPELAEAALAALHERSLPDPLFAGQPADRAVAYEASLPPPELESLLVGEHGGVLVEWREGPGRLLGRRFDDQRRLWELPFPGRPAAVAAGAWGLGWVANDDSLRGLELRSGEVIWERSLAGCELRGLVPVAGDLLLHCRDWVHRLGGDDGEDRWTVPIDLADPPQLATPRRLLGPCPAGEGPCAWEMGEDEPCWRFEQGASPAWWRVVDGLVLVRDGEGHVVAVDPDSGRRRWRSAGPVGQAPVVAGHSGLILWQDPMLHLVAVDRSRGRPLWRSAEPWPALDLLLVSRAGIFAFHDGFQALDRIDISSGQRLATERVNLPARVASVAAAPHRLDLLLRSEGGPVRLLRLDTGPGALAYRAIGQLRDIPLLMDLLDNGNSEVRYQAAVGLGAVGGLVLEPTLPRFTQLLEDPEPRVRGAAMYALGRSGLGAAVEPLSRRLMVEVEQMDQLVAALDSLDRRFLSRPELVALEEPGLQRLQRLDSLIWSWLDLKPQLARNSYCQLAMDPEQDPRRVALVAARLPAEELRLGKLLLERRRRLAEQLRASFDELSDQEQRVAQGLARRRELPELLY